MTPPEQLLPRPLRCGFSTSEPDLAGASALLAVLGDPIAHSKSPQLHHAAYTALGLSWDYARWQIPRGRLREALSLRQPGWRGVSVTAPLKAEAREFASTISVDARRSGAVNTLVFDSLSPQAPGHGENTDISGIVAAFANRNLTIAGGTAQVLGAGETAASAAIAAERLGAKRVEVFARKPERAHALICRLLADARCEYAAYDLAGWQPTDEVRLVADTIPQGFPEASRVASTVPANTVLLSAAYSPWPTPLAAVWLRESGPIVTGQDMLLFQALFQVRLFTGRTLQEPLPNEADLLARMRAVLP